jgi:hypothetical protein
LDTGVLIEIDKRGFPYAETVINELKKDGHEVLLPPSVEHEFLRPAPSGKKWGAFTPTDAARREALLKRLGLEVDTMANRVPMKQLQQWRDLGIKHGLSIPDADIVAQVRASAQARGVRNPVFLTRDGGGTIHAMRERGVFAVEFTAPATTAIVPGPGNGTPPAPGSGTPQAPGKGAPPAPGKGASPAPVSEAPAAPTTKAPPPPVSEVAPPSAGKIPMPNLVPKAPPEPRPSFFRARATAFKAGIRAGLEEAVSAANLASLIPEIILGVADKVAVHEAIRRIQTKFIKEGFAKGVAAGVMGWTEKEVADNLKNRITPFRVQGLGDPTATLTRSYILQLAEAYENYAVEIGYQFSSTKDFSWKQALRAKGLSVLKNYGYRFGRGDPEALFEYEFLDKLAWVLRPATDAMVGPAIRYN